mgnify:CR=1 FL=1
MATSRLDGVPEDAIDISSDGGLYKRILVEGQADSGSPPAGNEVLVHCALPTHPSELRAQKRHRPTPNPDIPGFDSRGEQTSGH